MENDNVTYHDTREIFERDKAYYAALEAWDTEQNLDVLRNFLKRQTEKTWEKQIARTGKRI